MAFERASCGQEARRCIQGLIRGIAFLRPGSRHGSVTSSSVRPCTGGSTDRIVAEDGTTVATFGNEGFASVGGPARRRVACP